jgi:hypothetical protein
MTEITEKSVMANTVGSGNGIDRKVAFDSRTKRDERDPGAGLSAFAARLNSLLKKCVDGANAVENHPSAAKAGLNLSGFIGTNKFVPLQSSAGTVPFSASLRAG